MKPKFTTKPETLNELCKVYQSPEDVQDRLIGTLYSEGIPRCIAECFNAYSIKDGGDPYWSESTLVKFLTTKAYSYPGLDRTISIIGPVLYRTILHHGTYPFKPEPDNRLTLERYAIAVSLLNAADQSRLSIKEQPRQHSVLERPRDWNDRCRLLFQSLCDTDWSKQSLENCRADGDDEDLIAVLYESMPRQQKWDRDRFLPVAATLPSSHSQKLDGRVLVEDMQALLRMLLVVTAGHSHNSTDQTQSELDSAVATLVCAFPTEDIYIDWKVFRMVIANSMPLLLTEMATFISSQFPVEKSVHAPFSVDYEWELPPAMTDAEPQSKRSFLSISQFCQLGLVIRRPYLDSLSLLQQSEPGKIRSSDLRSMLSSSSSPRLLVIRAITEHGPLVHVSYLPSLVAQKSLGMERLLKTDPFWLPGIDTDCLVQISPTHNVLRGSFDRARVDAGAAESLSIHLGGASLWLEEGLKKGGLSGGMGTLDFTPDLLEVWGR